MAIDMTVARRWLGDAAASHIPVLERVVHGLRSVEYDFMPNDAFETLVKSAPRRAMQVYWAEILFRAHFAAGTSVARTTRWLQGLLVHTENPNFTAFAAAYQGFLEASADSFDVFDNVSWWLAQLHADLRLAASGRMDEPTLCPALENALIHFTHAGYLKDENVADTHRAKQMKQYLKGLEGSGFPEINDCYRLLSDIAHPGSGSISCYAAPLSTPGRVGYRLALDQDAALITSFCSEYQNVTERTMFFGVVPPILVLRLLNELPLDALHTPAMSEIGVDNHPAWLPLADRLKDPRRMHEVREPFTTDGRSATEIGRNRHRP